MKLTPMDLWDRFRASYREFPEIGICLDPSRMNLTPAFLERMAEPMRKAMADMECLEKGAIANPDENRMVGHYWLRAPELAPTPEIRQQITGTIDRIKEFARDIHTGAITGTQGPFKNLLVIGIGGSALGPQFVANALGHPKTDKLKIYFLDNTDPDGMDKVYAALHGQLGQTLCVVISKSGGTKETRNGMLETKVEFIKNGLRFEQHAVAITGENSELDKLAISGRWLQRFPMWDWVGGRTSETSAVGLLPAALQGFDIDALLKGAGACDEVTRRKTISENPAALLALTWFYGCNGKGERDMVVLPYKDRLELFSRYLQQLIMESLGKERDLAGNIVHQGIAVYGNKGSTDQHAYVQQLRDGVNNFFTTFIQVLTERGEAPFYVEANVTSGDYLNGFYLGTRQALYENGRESVTITLQEVSPRSIGVLIALFERAVGFYASLVNINAYHQPGVEAGKKAATQILNLQGKIISFLTQKSGQKLTVQEIAEGVGAREEIEHVFKLLEYLAANPKRGVQRSAGTALTATYFKM